MSACRSGCLSLSKYLRVSLHVSLYRYTYMYALWPAYVRVCRRLSVYDCPSARPPISVCMVDCPHDRPPTRLSLSVFVYGNMSANRSVCMTVWMAVHVHCCAYEPAHESA